VLLNPKDPLGQTPERQLFELLSKVASGHDSKVVVGAAMNLLVNAVRQNHGTRQRAEHAFDELVGRTKNMLLEQHYDPVTNKRRNIFPFTQRVQAELVHWDDRKNKK
jgi:hypothetical protein